MTKEYRVGTITSRELAEIGADETVGDIEWLFFENGWRKASKKYDDVYRGHAEPDWETIATTVPPGTWLLSTVTEPTGAVFKIELLARKPDGHIYLLNFDHLVEIAQEKYPARVGEDDFEHFQRALSKWIKTDDMNFTGSMFRVGNDDEPEAPEDVAFGPDASVDLSGLPVSTQKWEPPKRRT
jgi:hypothetical protein